MLITGSVNLAALTHVKMEVKGKSGQVKGVFIPLDVNKLSEHEKGGVFLNVVGFEMKEPKEYGTHIVKQSLSKEVREKMSKEELEAMPILGNLKASDSQPAATDSNAAPDKTFKPDDKDLPF